VSDISTCQIESSLGKRTYDCHIHTLHERNAQTLFIRDTDSMDSFMLDVLVFSRYLKVDVAATAKQERSEWHYDLLGLQALTSELHEWCAAGAARAE
jgi:hypothetical protein